MTDAEYEHAIQANARRADISKAQCDFISESYWRDEVVRLSDMREAARAREHCATFDVLKGSPDHSRV